MEKLTKGVTSAESTDKQSEWQNESSPEIVFQGSLELTSFWRLCKRSQKTRTDIKSSTWKMTCLFMKPSKMSSVKEHEVIRDASKAPRCGFSLSTETFNAVSGGHQDSWGNALGTLSFLTVHFFFPFQLQVWKCFMLWDFWSLSKIAEIFQFCFQSWCLS